MQQRLFNNFGRLLKKRCCQQKYEGKQWNQSNKTWWHCWKYTTSTFCKLLSMGNCIHSVPIVKVTLNRSFSLAVFPVYSDPQMFFKMFVIWVKLLLQCCNYVAPLCEFLCALTGNHKSWIVSNIFRINKIICMYAISNAKHQSMFSRRSFQRSGFSPLWSLLMWADKFLLCTKSFPQTLQQYGLLPVWTLMWTIKL